MCEQCLQTPCHPRCPNAPEPKSVFVCSGCNEKIYDGDSYWEILGEQFCANCIDDAKGVATYDPN